jgi:crossover junction endodeoxyribonuclease RusA
MRHGFPVMGRPASVQSSPSSKRQYKMQVALAARSSLDKPVDTGQRIKIEIDWFTQDVANTADVDNIIKPIQDALGGIVFLDDCQVESVTARKHDATGVMRFMEEPLCIVRPLMNGHEEYIFVRIY